MPPGYAADSGYPLTRVEILEMERCKKGVTIGQPVFELGKCSVLLEIALHSEPKQSQEVQPSPCNIQGPPGQ